MRSELRNRAALISYEIARQKVDWVGGGEENTSPSPKAGGKPLRDGGYRLGGGGKGV